MIVAAFSREPLGPVPEVVFAVLGGDEIVDGIAGKCNVRRICVHFTVLKEGPIDVTVYEIVIELQHSELCILVDEKAYVEG